MKKFLFLRGTFDDNNRRNLKTDSDFWCQLFAEIVGKNDHGYIWYRSPSERIFHYRSNIWVVTKSTNDLKAVDYVIARGAFDYYKPILKKCKNAHKTYYGAGSRMFPQDGIHYDMILVDCEHDRKKAEKKYPKSKVVLWTKPCARHFKPMDVKKKYDVCYVCPNPKDKRKRVGWVYKTLPKDLRMLQLGNPIKAPKNVKVKRVAAIKMPRMYNKCRVLIAPYTSDDSAPRCMIEALACNVPVVCLKGLKHDLNFTHNCYIETKETFWKQVRGIIKDEGHPLIETRGDYCRKFLSLERTAAYLRENICS